MDSVEGILSFPEDLKLRNDGKCVAIERQEVSNRNRFDVEGRIQSVFSMIHFHSLRIDHGMRSLSDTPFDVQTLTVFQCHDAPQQ